MTKVRPATADDADAIGELHVRSWQVAYRGMFPDDYLDGLDVGDRRRVWAERLAVAHEVLVVEAAGGTVAGFAGTARAGEHDDGPPEPGLGVLNALYLAPEHWGVGLGRPLLDAATDRLRERGFTAAILWVLRDNERARRFYERAGWAFDGTEQVETRFGPPVVEVRYRRPL